MKSKGASLSSQRRGRRSYGNVSKYHRWGGGGNSFAFKLLLIPGASYLKQDGYFVSIYRSIRIR